MRKRRLPRLAGKRKPAAKFHYALDNNVKIRYYKQVESSEPHG